MKHFLFRVGVFCGIASAWMGVQYLINRNFHEQINIDEKIWVVGDSHGMTAVDPAMLPSARNLCEGAENYLFTYYKLLHLLKQNPAVAQIWLAFNTNNFSKYQDQKLMGARAKSHFSRYFPVLPLTLPQRVPLNKIKFYNSGVRRMLLYPDFKHDYLGKYHSGKPTLEKANLEETLNHHYYSSGHAFIGISQLQSAYLDSIHLLLEAHEIEMKLFTTPQHAKYFEGIPDKLIAYTDSLGQHYRSKGIEWLKHDQSIVLPDVYFRDYDHLSAEGARWFTNRIKEKIRPQKRP